MYRIIFLASFVGACAESIRVLFVGNSFTFVNELPQQLAHVAASFGDTVEVASSTKGGCTLFALSELTQTAKLLEQDWDYIVLQDYSLLPTVRRARSRYLNPAVQHFVAQKKKAQIVMYLTWGYHDGIGAACPSSDTASCFPNGTLAELTDPSCDSSSQYSNSVKTFECMGYSLARGYFSTLGLGPDRVAPCGLAWQTVRGSQSIPEDCKGLVDAEYSEPLELHLPLQVKGAALPSRSLNIIDSPDVYDKHPSRAGQYLNALVFYATLFGKSPVGADPPLNTKSWGLPDVPLTDAEVQALQRAAEGTVKQCGKACGLSESFPRIPSETLFL